MSDYTPKLQHKFWTLGNIGRASFGELVHLLMEVALWGSVK